MPKKITLLGNRVAVVPLAQDERSHGGILLPESARNDNKRYRVLGVGPGRKLKNGAYAPVEAKPGDVVLIAPYHPHHIFKEKDGEVRIFDAAAIELVELSGYLKDSLDRKGEAA